jgi:hypothetical protein
MAFPIFTRLPNNNICSSVAQYRLEFDDNRQFKTMIIMMIVCNPLLQRFEVAINFNSNLIIAVETSRINS